MRRSLLILVGLFSLATQAQAANSTVSAMTSATAFGGTELLYVVQGAADRKGTPAQFATYIYGLASGDCTISGVGAVVCTKTNGTAFTALATTAPGTGVATALGIAIGSAGAFTTFNGAHGTPSSMTLTNATGLPISTGLSGAGAGVLTWMGTPTSANLIAALTDETGTGSAVFGTAPTISSPTINTAATLGFVTGSTQCLQVNTSGAISGTGAACGGSGSTGANPTATAGPTAVNGVATTFMRSDGAPAVQQGTSSQKGIVQVDGTTITASSGVISAAPVSAVPSVQSGANYPIVDGDRSKVVYLSNATAQTPTLPSAATLTNTSGWFVTVCNIAAGIQTITPTTSTIGGAASYALPGGSAASPRCVNVVSDGTNYSLVPQGNAYTIASGTAALGTSAIASAACATVVTATATGTATTDVLTASFNGDPTAVTGYIPATAGMLTIISYPTANTANFKVCNNTSASITPGAITLNWRVVR